MSWAELISGYAVAFGSGLSVGFGMLALMHVFASQVRAVRDYVRGVGGR
jgi:hypothetical protein